MSNRRGPGVLLNRRLCIRGVGTHTVANVTHTRGYITRPNRKLDSPATCPSVATN